MSLTTDSDRRHLARAIEIAEQGRGRVSPNPMVGAVIADGEQVIGEGFHGALGGPHAEVEAIRAAGEASLSKATLYVSLEPCCHEGRTPPASLLGDLDRPRQVAAIAVGGEGHRR
jgi:diaminohydroxyphosphoribosylaminopyrimidine deaminase/5-amino-6-(5-phosphoribosylamino)uracil reductase